MEEFENQTELAGRYREVLTALIGEYVVTGKPVGSQRIAGLCSERLSPATMRNVMARLEREGFLLQPHTSAGRIPTRKAYRLYVQSLVNAEQLSEDVIRNIRVCLEQQEDPGELMTKTCEILSEYTNNIGIVLSPPVSEIVMKHIEFVRLKHHRILIILVSQAGVVRQKAIQFEEELSQADLDQAARYLVDHFSGMNLIQIRKELKRLVSLERAAYDSLMRNAARLGEATLSSPLDSEKDSPDIYFGGASRLFQNLDSTEMAKLTSLLAALEEKSRLVRIISECVGCDTVGPKVTIGLENHIPGMKNWTLIASPYTFDHYSSGSVGILGPSRMEYGKTISLVASVAKLFGQVLQTR